MITKDDLIEFLEGVEGNPIIKLSLQPAHGDGDVDTSLVDFIDDGDIVILLGEEE